MCKDTECGGVAMKTLHRFADADNELVSETLMLRPVLLCRCLMVSIDLGSCFEVTYTSYTCS